MEPARYKGIIFDLDGTLIDSLEDIADSANLMLATFGLPQHPLDAYRHFVGDGMRVLMRRIVPVGTAEEKIDSCLALYRQTYGEQWHCKTAPYAGIDQMLSRCAEAGLKIAVLSNKPDDFTKQCIAQFFPQFNFAEIRGEQEGIPRKPHPVGAVEIVRRLLLAPADCLFVGDTAIDIKTGKSAGMYSVGVTWGFRDKRELIEAGADLIINHPNELIDHVIFSQ